MITIRSFDHTYIIIETSSSEISKQISDDFSYEVENFQYSNAYARSKGSWDGRKYLFKRSRKDPCSGKLYKGLLQRFVIWCKERNYSLSDPENLLEFQIKGCNYPLIFKELNSKTNKPLRDYQEETISRALNYDRCILLSPTASGKSLSLWGICEYLSWNGKPKILLIVPRISLISQMKSDFLEYSSNEYDKYIRTSKDETLEFQNEEFILISTWQTLQNQEKEFFEQFKVILADEVHSYDARVCTSILENSINARMRIGVTGTLKDSKTSSLVLEGLFGPITRVASTSELIEQNHLVSMNPIDMILLKYSKDDSSRRKYQDEIKFINESQKRLDFVCSEAARISSRGPTLVLFSRVESHGKQLFEYFQYKYSHIPVEYVSGEIEANSREDIRQKMNENKKQIVLFASMGTFSTGINIPYLQNIILASPTKARVSLLQSIGRGLRNPQNKEPLQIIDIIDDLSYGAWRNYALRHGLERQRIYIEENFPWHVRKIQI